VLLASAMKAVQIDINTAGATTLRIGVYADTANGPGALLTQTADIAGGTTGAVTTALSVPAGACWLAVQNTGSAAVTPRTISGANPFLSGLDAPGANNLPNTWLAVSQGTSLPSTFPLGSVSRTGLFVALFLQAS
jgi:hypothetical protein